MNILLALLLFVFAGLINGAFALPTKYVSKWRFENIWLCYSVWAFLLLPWLAMWILVPNVFQIYAAVSFKDVMVMIIGGFLFGAGQVGFAFSIGMIGIGLAFVICLGLGTGLGFLLPLVFQHPEQLFQPFGLVTIFGTVLAILGIILSTWAGQIRDKIKGVGTEQQLIKSKHYYLLGVILAAIAGFFSAGQNFSFSLTSDMHALALSMGASRLGDSIIMWPGFLLFSFIPYMCYMIYLQYRNRSFHFYLKKGGFRYYLFALIMGACWFGSLIFYSEGSQKIGQLGPVVGWPLFMVFIILTSNFLGWRYHEWDHCGRKAKVTLWMGLLFLILSVVVLSHAALVHT